MLRYASRRLLGMIPTFIGITLLVFALMRALPTDPVRLEATRVGAQRGAVTEAELALLRKGLRLDLPVLLNLHVEDRRSRIAQAVQVLKRPDATAEAKASARQTIGRYGRLGVAELRRFGLSDEADRLDAALGRPSPRAPSVIEAWVADPPAIEPGADEPVASSGASAGVGKVVRAIDLQAEASELVPRLYAALLGPRQASPAVQRRRLALVAQLEGFRLSWPGDPAGQRSARRTLAEHWRDARYEWIELGRLERLLSTFTRTQYGGWLVGLVRGEMGRSFRDGRPVRDLLAEALPRTLLLSLLAAALAYLVAIPLGAWSAARAGTLGERLLSLGLFALYSLPSFWLALLLLFVFASGDVLGWLPARGLGTVRHLILPVICLAHFSLAALSRYQRAALLDALRADYIRTARAKGLDERRVVLKHGLRNALMPIVTLLGYQVPLLLSGSVIIERIFDIPGMGLLMLDALEHLDYFVVLGAVAWSALLAMTGVLLADLAYGLVDPRIAAGAAREERR